MLQDVDPSRLHGRLQAVPVSGRLAVAGRNESIVCPLDPAGTRCDSRVENRFYIRP